MAQNGVNDWSGFVARFIYGDAYKQSQTYGTDQADPGARATGAILSGQDPLDAIMGRAPQNQPPPPSRTAPQNGIAPGAYRAPAAPPPGYADDPDQQ